MVSNCRLPNIRKILIIRNDGIGDLLNSTPAISLLRQNYPGAEFTVLTRSSTAPILIGNPDVDRILTFDRQGAHQRLMSRLKFYLGLRREKYDLVVAMRTASWSHFLSCLSGARYRLGRRQKRFKSTLTHVWRERYRKGYVQEVDRNYDLVGLICEGDGDRRLVFKVLDEEFAHAKRQLADWGIAPNDDLVCIHPGASSFDKRWPEENYAEIADALVRERRAKVLILRGPEETALAWNIQSAMQADSIAYAPKSVRELGALIQCCSLVVCNDSGPMHIAAALDVPTVAIFGPTDHVAWKPLSKNATVVRRDMPCWPCSAHKCKIGWECTKKLRVDLVWEKVEALTKSMHSPLRNP